MAIIKDGKYLVNTDGLLHAIRMDRAVGQEHPYAIFLCWSSGLQLRLDYVSPDARDAMWKGLTPDTPLEEP